MQHKTVYLLFCKFTLRVSGVNHTHHKEYTKLELQPPVLVIFFVQLHPSNVAKLACSYSYTVSPSCLSENWRTFFPHTKM